jgi:hypothetical protein
MSEPKHPKCLSSTMSIRFCSTCGRTDRVNHLPPRHYRNGTLCGGEIEVAVYRFDRTLLPPKMDRL